MLISVLIILWIFLNCVLECHRASLALQQFIIMNCVIGQLKSIPCTDNRVSYSNFVCGFPPCRYAYVLARMNRNFFVALQVWGISPFSFENVVFIAQVTFISNGTWHQTPNNDGGTGSQYLEYSRSGCQAKNGKL